MKLYLGSFAQTRYAGMTDVAAAIERDLSRAAGARVGVALRGPAAFGVQSIRELAGESLDDLPVACDSVRRRRRTSWRRAATSSPRR